MAKGEKSEDAENKHYFRRTNSGERGVCISTIIKIGQSLNGIAINFCLCFRMQETARQANWKNVCLGVYL
jgi:hypothetical protein